MKVLHIYKSYYNESIGGVEKTIFSLAKELSPMQVISDVVTTTSQKKIYKDKIMDQTVYFYPRTIDIFSCPMSFQLLRHFRQVSQSYDILHYHFPWPFSDLVHLASHTGKPAVLTYHSDIVRQKVANAFYQPLMHQFLKRMNCIVATSNNLLQSSPVLNRYKNKTRVVPIGLEPPLIPENKDALLKKWRELCFGEPFFLFIGVLRYYKGLHILLEALKGTRIPVVIAGSGPEEKNLLRLARQSQLNSVRFVGKISEEDKWALLELCHAVIVPSHLRTEAFCISLLEGLMHGRPLISTEVGTGTSFVNMHDVSGIVVPPANPGALKSAMQRLLNDCEYYTKLRQGTWAHYHQYFTAEKMGDGYLDIYKSVIYGHNT